MQSLLEQLNTAEQKLSQAALQFGSGHTEVTSASNQVAVLKDRINYRAAGFLAGLETKVAASEQMLEQMKAEVERAKETDIKAAAESQPYWEAKHKLEEAMRFRTMLYTKIAMEQTDLNLPKLSMAKIVESATIGLHPVRPNKPLNIALGFIIGFGAGLLLATLLYLLQWWAFWRESTAPSARFGPEFRAICHVAIALVVGFVVGITCTGSYGIFIIPLVLLLGGMASAYIELTHRLPAPAGAQKENP